MNGILFKPDMIQAIIEGRKTVTRRVIKQLTPEFEWEVIDVGEPIIMAKDGIGGCIFLKKRYQVGETVYIKEAWMLEHNIEGCSRLDDFVTIHYSNASTRKRWGDIIDNEAGVFLVSVAKAFDKPRCEQPPMFMPEVLARYFLEITDVRAERLNQITDTDAVKEGIPNGAYAVNPISSFRKPWNSINKEKWESNPWVFVYTFRIKR